MEGRSRTPLKLESCVDSFYAATVARSLVWFRCTNQHIKAVEEALGMAHNTSTTWGEYEHTKEWRIMPIPVAFGGIGPLPLPTEQHLSCHGFFVQQFGEYSSKGNKLQCSQHLLQLQVGKNMNSLTLDNVPYGKYVPSSWLTCLWESVSMADTLCLPK